MSLCIVVYLMLSSTLVNGVKKMNQDPPEKKMEVANVASEQHLVPSAPQHAPDIMGMKTFHCSINCRKHRFGGRCITTVDIAS